ncbi:MAG: hypothetical protein ACOX6T_10680 [Myxococcales bacterium]|jgi:hypothetical protein
MPFCPSCHSEYREGIERCAHCELELVAELPETDAQKSERLRELADKNEAAHIARASYAEACQMVELLQSRGVDAMVSGDPSSCGKGGHCAHFLVSVLPEDVRAAAAVLQDEFRKLVDANEECQGANPDAVVDFDAEGAHACPACGTTFEGTKDECPECGLFLGAA